MSSPRWVVAVGVIASAMAVAADAASASGVGGCVEAFRLGYCVEWDVPTPGNPGRDGGSGSRSPDEVECYWATISLDLGSDPLVWVDFGLAQPPAGIDIVWQEWRCSDGSTQFDFRWVVAATPANLASVARGRLLGLLPQPAIASSPPIGTASIVGVPVFVEVMNWTSAVTESECAGGLCVTVTATPALTFSPGEVGSAAIACAGSGSRYDPDGDSIEAQRSAPGACAFPYRLRTGVMDRPASWDGSVSVTWTISWTASTGASGSLASVARSTAVPRAVEEVQTVVVGGATP